MVHQMKKIIKMTLNKIITIIFCLIFTASANATGFIFNWESFVVDKDLFLGKPDKNAFINNSPVFDLETLDYEKYDDKFSLYDEQQSVSTNKSGKKPLRNNIKIKVLSTDGIMDDKYRINSDSDEERISKVINAMTSLIYDDSKFKSLETIGKIIEPRINFYFEF